MSEVEGVGEQHLMKEVIEPMGEKQIGGYKQAGCSGNDTVCRQVGLQAGIGNIKEMEMVQVNQKRMEEAEIDDGLVISQLRPNKKKWKRQARVQGDGGSKVEIGTQKRPSGETFRQNPNKKTKLTRSSKPELNKLVHFPPTTRVKLSREPLILEDMEVMESNLAEISTKAGSQPCRKP